MTTSERIKEALKELANGLCTIILATVVLMKAEAVIGSGDPLSNMIIYLLLIGVMVIGEVLLYGEAARYLKHRRDRFDDRVVGVVILTLFITWTMPLLAHWWQSEPHPSISLGKWMLIPLSPATGNPPDWLVPLLSALLLTIMGFALLRKTGAVQEMRAEQKRHRKEAQQNKTTIELKKHLKEAKELVSSYEYQASNWRANTFATKDAALAARL